MNFCIHRLCWLKVNYTFVFTRLTDAATDVTVQLFEQKYIQEQIHHSQQESLKVQTNMRKDNEDLYNTVVRVKDVFDDFS